MNIHYIKLNPTGNITVLVTTPVPRPRQAAVAAKLLAPDGVGGEQVGYLEAAADARAEARLQMMGGEFCGNATMALGALLCRRDGLADGQARSLRLEVSGSAGTVPCSILREGDDWLGTVRMPLPTAIEQVDLVAGDDMIRAPLVRMPGIAHLIIPAGIGLGEAEVRRLLPGWNAAIGADALGALLWNAPSRFINPIVYVPSANTLVREHGCGSGTAAVGSWLATAAGETCEMSVRQPGGSILVRAAMLRGRLAVLTITGCVKIEDEGEVSIPDD